MILITNVFPLQQNVMEDRICRLFWSVFCPYNGKPQTGQLLKNQNWCLTIADAVKVKIKTSVFSEDLLCRHGKRL